MEVGGGIVCRQCQMANALSLDNWVDLGSPPQPPCSTDTVDGRFARTCSSCPLGDRHFCQGTRSSVVCVCVCVCERERDRQTDRQREIVRFNLLYSLFLPA